MPPPSGVTRPGSGPRRETPTTHNEKIAKLDRANDNTQEKVSCSIPHRFHRPKPCQTVGRSTRRDTKYNNYYEIGATWAAYPELQIFV